MHNVKKNSYFLKFRDKKTKALTAKRKTTTLEKNLKKIVTKTNWEI